MPRTSQRGTTTCVVPRLRSLPIRPRRVRRRECWLGWSWADGLDSGRQPRSGLAGRQRVNAATLDELLDAARNRQHARGLSPVQPEAALTFEHHEARLTQHFAASRHRRNATLVSKPAGRFCSGRKRRFRNAASSSVRKRVLSWVRASRTCRVASERAG